MTRAFALHVAALPLAALGLLNPLIGGRVDGVHRGRSQSAVAPLRLDAQLPA